MPCERKIWLIVLSLMTMLSSCSVTSLREAQEVVAQADSLWHEGRMYGVDEGDSATLAQAYEAFRHFPLSCGVLYIEIVANNQIIGAVPIPMNIQYHI